MRKGWIKLHRKLLNNPIWQDPHYLKLWMYCLLQTSHAEHDQLVGNQIIKLSPGEFVTGRISLAEELNKGVSPKKRQSESTWWRDLKKLEELGMLDIKPNNKFSVVTIANWDFYQDSDKELNAKRTTDEQQMDNSWTADEQQMNTNKNVKNLRIKELENEDIKSSRKQVYDEESPPFILATFFFNEILKNDPKRRKPNIQTWSDDIRKMIELDKRDKKEIGELMRWVQQDDFERANVLSPSKLRTRYTSLLLKMNNPKSSNVTSIKPPVYERSTPNEITGKRNESDSSKFGNVRLFK